MSILYARNRAILTKKMLPRMNGRKIFLLSLTAVVCILFTAEAVETKLRHQSSGNTLEPADDKMNGGYGMRPQSDDPSLDATEMGHANDAAQATADVSQHTIERSSTLQRMAKYFKFVKSAVKRLGIVGNLISPLIECHNEWKRSESGEMSEKVALCITGMCRKRDDVVVGVLAGLSGGKVGALTGGAVASVVPGVGTATGVLVGGIGGGIAAAIAADKAHSNSTIDRANDKLCQEKHPQVQEAVNSIFDDFKSHIGNMGDNFDNFAAWWKKKKALKDGVHGIVSKVFGADDPAQVAAVGGRKCVRTSTFSCGRSTDCISDPDVPEGTPSCNGEYACYCDTSGINACTCKLATQNEREVDDSDKAMKEENCPLFREGAQFALQASEEELIGCAAVSLKSAYNTNSCCDEPDQNGCSQIKDAYDQKPEKDGDICET